MASAWRALMKLLGLGKQQPARFHPYDEVSDEQLNENRQRAPRLHPYDEVSDDQLQQNRAGGKNGAAKPPRLHPYDEVTPQASGPQSGPAKMKVLPGENGGTGASNDASLNYADVEIQPGLGKGSNCARRSEEPIIYSEVRPSSKPT